MYSGYSLGILSAALVAIGLLEQFGWRSVIAFGALPLLLIWLIAHILPESLEYISNKGLHSQAKQLEQKLDMNYRAPTKQEQPKKSQRYCICRFCMAAICEKRAFLVALFYGMLLVWIK